MASSSRSSDALIRYALENKPGQVGERYVMASGVGGLLVSLARQQMRDVRRKWGKDRPGAFVHAYHVIQSFGRDELDPALPASWMTAQMLGRALAEAQFSGRQVLVVTQRDGKTGCVHNHIVINSVDLKTGKSLNSSLVMHARLVEVHERVLAAEGFQQRTDLKQAFSDAVDRRERGERSGLRRVDSRKLREEREFQNYILWEVENQVADEFGIAHQPEPFCTTVLKNSIEHALSDPNASDWATFVEAGRKHGVVIALRGRESRAISYGMLRTQGDGSMAEPSFSDTRRGVTLGEGFQMAAIEVTLAANSAALDEVVEIPEPESPSALLTLAGGSRAKVLSAEETLDRLRLALEDVHASADRLAQPGINAFRTAHADPEGRASLVSARDSAKPKTTSSIQGRPGDSPSDEADESGPAEIVSPSQGSAPTPDNSDLGSESHHPTADSSAVTDAEAETETETETIATTGSLTLKELNRRNRRLGLPEVLKSEFEKNQRMNSEQRRRRQLHPELFVGDKEPTTRSSPRRSFE